MARVDTKKDVWEQISLKGWRPYVWIISLIILAYVWTVGFGYSYLDDNSLIINSRHQLQDIKNVMAALSGDHNPGDAPFYRPLLLVSFILNYGISGPAPWGYHLVNIILHIAACLLFFELLRRISLGVGPALLVCLLFSVHPLNVQAVAWIPGRNETLLALPVLAGVIYFIKFIRGGGTANLLASLSFLALSLLTKESAVVLPLVAAGHAALVQGTGLKSKRMWTYLGLSLAIIAAWYWLRAGILGPGPEWQNNRFISLPEFAFMALTYLGKTFMPIRLSPVAVPQIASIVTGMGAVAVLAVLIRLKGIGDKSLFWFGLLWMTAFILPYFARGSFVTLFLEHRFYLPLMGLLMAMAQVNLLRTATKVRGAVVGVPLVIALALAGSISYGAAFKDRQTFWDRAGKTSPECSLVLYNQGLICQEQGKLDMAAEKYLLALEYTPDYAAIHNSLGAVYQAGGRYAEAEARYLQALKYNRNFAQAHDNLGSLYYRQGQLDRAQAEFSRAIAVNDLPDAHNNLGSLHYYQGRYDEAGREFLRAVELDPGLVPARINLGSFYLKTGHTEKARQEYLAALRSDPGNADAGYNLSLIYSAAGSYDAAERLLEETARAHPEERMLYFQLSSVYFLDGKYQRSAQAYDRFLGLGGRPDREIAARLQPFRKNGRK